MTYTFFTTSDSDEEEEEKYSSFVDIEDFEDDEPQGFEGVKKGSELNSSSPDSVGPIPWDPSESFFAYL